MRKELIARSLALFLGFLALCNLSGELLSPRFSANLWWIDLRFVPTFVATTTLWMSAVLLLAFGLRPAMARWRRNATLTVTLLLAAAALQNAAQFYFLLARAAIGSRFPVALSLFVVFALVMIAWSSFRTGSDPVKRFDSVRLALLLLVWAGSFPLLQTLCFGKTDYRRAADVAVVFGARAYANGQPSDALADRVRTACELYQQGIVRKLIFSGGPGDGPIHETEAMRRMALSLGVKEEDIVLDREGLNTEQTVTDTIAMFHEMNVGRVLAVSHFYHLPRIKMAYQRLGWDVYTVPAEERYFLKQIPYSMAREVAAFWAYYWRPIV